MQGRNNPSNRREIWEDFLAAFLGKYYPMQMDTREAFIALNMIEGVGPVRARSLLEHFGEAPKILAASKSALLRVRNIGEDIAEKISSWEKSVDLPGELKRISDFGCHVLISSDENYPPLLREIYDPPLVLDVPIYKTRDHSHQFPNRSGFKSVPLK